MMTAGSIRYASGVVAAVLSLVAAGTVAGLAITTGNEDAGPPSLPTFPPPPDPNVPDDWEPPEPVGDADDDAVPVTRPERRGNLTSSGSDAGPPSLPTFPPPPDPNVPDDWEPPEPVGDADEPASTPSATLPMPNEVVDSPKPPATGDMALDITAVDGDTDDCLYEGSSNCVPPATYVPITNPSTTVVVARPTNAEVAAPTTSTTTATTVRTVIVAPTTTLAPAKPAPTVLATTTTTVTPPLTVPTAEANDLIGNSSENETHRLIGGQSCGDIECVDAFAADCDERGGVAVADAVDGGGTEVQCWNSAGGDPGGGGGCGSVGDAC